MSVSRSYLLYRTSFHEWLLLRAEIAAPPLHDVQYRNQARRLAHCEEPRYSCASAMKRRGITQSPIDRASDQRRNTGCTTYRDLFCIRARLSKLEEVSARFFSAKPRGFSMRFRRLIGANGLREKAARQNPYSRSRLVAGAGHIARASEPMH